MAINVVELAESAAALIPKLTNLSSDLAYTVAADPMTDNIVFKARSRSRGLVGVSVMTRGEIADSGADTNAAMTAILENLTKVIGPVARPHIRPRSVYAVGGGGSGGCGTGGSGGGS